MDMQRLEDEIDWTFANDNTRDYTHIYHDYPARMIPQIPRAILSLIYKKEYGLLFDPYCGSGTSLVEGLMRGMDVVGTDINPLARLISKSKIEYSIDPRNLEAELNRFVEFTLNPKLKPLVIKKDNLSFWFKEGAIRGIGLIMRYISSIQDRKIRDFFKVAASETIRESSNTRKGEFKLYRYPEEKLKHHNPDPFAIMKFKLFRNFEGYEQFYETMAKLSKNPKARIYSFNTVKGIAKDRLPNASVDIVITSPPYGDSHTTVAYGQYSRLSMEWLGISKGDVDRMSMGGNKTKEVVNFDCGPLDRAIEEVAAKKPKRALEVTSFYADLRNSIKNVSKVIKEGGYACYVVANRRVAGVVLPTDQAIKCFFERYGFFHVRTFSRKIPNKRMPSRNSPTNIAGKTEQTMNKELIVVMEKM